MMEYIEKNNKIKCAAREVFEKEIVKKVREYLCNDFGKKKWVFEVFLVGSAKRNLILVGNEGFDLDYQLRFSKMPLDYLNDAKKTKLKFKEYFDKAVHELNLNLSFFEDSTHVLTSKKLDNRGQVIYSYDIAILRYNFKNNYIILKNEKKGKKNDYHYIELSNCENFKERYKMIKTPQKWNLLRKIYKKKKEFVQKISKDERPHSFSLLGETVNEVIQSK